MILMLVAEKDNELLCAPVTRNEIWKVVKSMSIDKAPGPDGLPVEFSQRFWDIVGTNVMDTVKFFL